VSRDTSSFCNEDCADSWLQHVELQQTAMLCKMESCRSVGSGAVACKESNNVRLPCVLKKKKSERHRICEQCRVIATDAVYLVIVSVRLETCHR
jgi:hypothetical protein